MYLSTTKKKVNSVLCITTPRLLFSSLFWCFSRAVQTNCLANAGIRYIFGARWNDHISPLRKKLKWLLNDTRRDYFAMLLIYRVVRMKEPPLLLPLFKPYRTDKPKRGPRQDLSIPSVSTNSGFLSFQVIYAKLWNAIPPCIRYIPSYSRFKKSIKVYYVKFENNNQW